MTCSEFIPISIGSPQAVMSNILKCAASVAVRYVSGYYMKALSDGIAHQEDVFISEFSSLILV